MSSSRQGRVSLPAENKVKTLLRLIRRLGLKNAADKGSETMLCSSSGTFPVEDESSSARSGSLTE